MYPEQEEPEAPASYAGGSMKSRAMHLEGLIPLVLILIIVAFLGAKFGFWNLPFLPGMNQKISLLIIGAPSDNINNVLFENRDLVQYRIKDAPSMSINAKEQLAQYDVVMLNQSTLADKSITRQLGDALENYVKTGGKLITVMDSGIYRGGEMGIAKDVTGWVGTIGDIVPVDCVPLADNTPSCTQPLNIRGQIVRADFSHPIMKGIEFAPSLPGEEPYAITTFKISETGKEIAYIKNMVTPAYYPGIVEKNLVLGKSIYFNYDPGLTPAIFEKTLEYLSGKGGVFG